MRPAFETFAKRPLQRGVVCRTSRCALFAWGGGFSSIAPRPARSPLPACHRAPGVRRPRCAPGRWALHPSPRAPRLTRRHCMPVSRTQTKAMACARQYRDLHKRRLHPLLKGPAKAGDEACVQDPNVRQCARSTHCSVPAQDALRALVRVCVCVCACVLLRKAGRSRDRMRAGSVWQRACFVFKDAPALAGRGSQHS